MADHKLHLFEQEPEVLLEEIKCPEGQVNNRWNGTCVDYHPSVEVSSFIDHCRININQEFINKYSIECFNSIANTLQISPTDVFIKNKIGEGAYGGVYLVNIVRQDKIYESIIKIEDLEKTNRPIERAHQEYAQHIFFFSKDFPVPEPYYHIISENQFAITIMRLNELAVEVGMLKNILQTRAPISFLKFIIQFIDDIFQQFVKRNITHSDLHLGNIGIQNANKMPFNTGKQFAYYSNSKKQTIFLSPLLIDFGFASSPLYLELDFIQLIRTLITFGRKLDPENKKYLNHELLTLMSKYYQAKQCALKPDYFEWDENYFDDISYHNYIELIYTILTRDRHERNFAASYKKVFSTLNYLYKNKNVPKNLEFLTFCFTHVVVNKKPIVTVKILLKAYYDFYSSQLALYQYRFEYLYEIITTPRNLNPNQQYMLDVYTYLLYFIDLIKIQDIENIIMHVRGLESGDFFNLNRIYLQNKDIRKI